MDAKTIIAAVLIGFIVGGIVYLQVKRKKK